MAEEYDLAPACLVCGVGVGTQRKSYVEGRTNQRNREGPVRGLCERCADLGLYWECAFCMRLPPKKGCSQAVSFMFLGTRLTSANRHEAPYPRPSHGNSGRTQPLFSECVAVPTQPRRLRLVTMITSRRPSRPWMSAVDVEFRALNSGPQRPSSSGCKLIQTDSLIWVCLPMRKQFPRQAFVLSQLIP